MGQTALQIHGEGLDAAAVAEATREWTGLSAGPELAAFLDRHESPDGRQIPAPAGLLAELRPYQRVGLSWLHFLAKLGLGAQDRG